MTVSQLHFLVYTEIYKEFGKVALVVVRRSLY